MEETMNDFLPTGSICKDCLNCMVRVIEPLDNDAWEIIGETVDGSTALIHCICLASDIDLNDHVVRVCNKFDGVHQPPNPFMVNKFLWGNL